MFNLLALTFLLNMSGDILSDMLIQQEPCGSDIVLYHDLHRNVCCIAMCVSLCTGDVAQQTRDVQRKVHSTLVHRLRRWPNIESILVERLVFTGRLLGRS